MQPPIDEAYRTCSECGGDTIPEPFEADGHIRIAFVCLQRGTHTVLSPFSE